MVRDFVRSGLVPYACQLRVSKDSAALCARNFIILGRLAKAGMVLASSPSIEEVRTGAGRELVEALLLTERPEEQLRAQLLTIPELEELQLRRLSIGDGGGGAAAARRKARRPSSPRAGRRSTGPRESVPGLADRYAPKRAATVRVDTRVLDDLINIVGEMLITRERLQEISRDLESEELHLNLDRLRVLVRGFQDTIMTVRMMPLELVTDRLPRIVRDLAHQSGKQVAFEVLGQKIELDCAILEELNDVLIHLVRNAIDHGVEAPERRAAAGKPPKAVIRVRAGRERDWVGSASRTTGAGWIPTASPCRDRARPRQRRARRRHGGAREAPALLPPRREHGRTRHRHLRPWCRDGRGQVQGRRFRRRAADRLAAGPGAALTLRLPLTLAIIKILLVEVRVQEFGLPVCTCCARPRWIRRHRVVAAAAPAASGPRLVPLHDLGVLLGLPPRDLRSHPGLFLAVSEFGERAAGLAVDRLLGTYEVVIKPLGPPLKRVRGLAGVTVMGDGRTVLLLDIAALI